MNDEITIINQFEETIDGIIYVATVYSDGTIVKHRKEGFENAITDTEARALELEANVQYLVDLTEINMEEM